MVEACGGRELQAGAPELASASGDGAVSSAVAALEGRSGSGVRAGSTDGLTACARSRTLAQLFTISRNA